MYFTRTRVRVRARARVEFVTLLYGCTIVKISSTINIVKKYRDSRYIAIVVTYLLTYLLTIKNYSTRLTRGEGVIYSMTTGNNLTPYGWARSYRVGHKLMIILLFLPRDAL